MPRAFTDSVGRQWVLDVNCTSIGQVRATAGVDLLTVLDDKGALFGRLATDPILLCGVLWALCKDQAAAVGVSPEDFGRGLRGDVIDAAVDALIEEVVDFSPGQTRRLAARKMLGLVRETADRAGKMAMAHLESPRLHAAIDRKLKKLADSFGDALESYESTPEPGPSGNSSRPSTPTNATSGAD